MKTAAIILLVFGILIMISGIAVLGMTAFADTALDNLHPSTVEVPSETFTYATVPGAEKIEGDYSVTGGKIDVYISEELPSGYSSDSSELDSISKKSIGTGKTSGDIDYETESDTTTYYIIFDNPYDDDVTVKYSIAYGSMAGLGICWALGAILLIVGIVLMVFGIMIDKKAKKKEKEMPPPPMGGPGAPPPPPPGYPP
ncbi:MAG: hypothetical protein JSV49_08205, partial [Thermoplasmata archaeon]